MRRSSDIFPDTYKDGTLIRCWGLDDDGQLVCVSDAISVTDLNAKSQRIFNTKLRDRLLLVEDYEDNFDEETTYDQDTIDLAELRAGDTSNLESVQSRTFMDRLIAGPEALESTDVLYVPKTITRRQLILGMWRNGMITSEEAVAASTGAVPDFVDALFESLSEQEATAARVTWASMKEVCRDDPLFIAVAAATGRSPEEIDAFMFDASII